jgi:hypothetical protein
MAVVSANAMSARAASKCISCQTECIGSNYRPCGASVESHCSTGMHPLLISAIEAVTKVKIENQGRVNWPTGRKAM